MKSQKIRDHLRLFDLKGSNDQLVIIKCMRINVAINITLKCIGSERPSNRATSKHWKLILWSLDDSGTILATILGLNRMHRWKKDFDYRFDSFHIGMCDIECVYPVFEYLLKYT